MILAGALTAALSFLFLVLTQKNFKASTDYLIVQNQNNNQDFYTLSKSAEYLGNILSEAVYSERFVNEVADTGKISASFLPTDKKDRLEEWAKTVKVKRNLSLGLITVTAYSNNQVQLQNLSDAIEEVFTTKNYLFRGTGQDLDVRVLTGPILEKNPSLLDIALVMVGGFFIGAFLVFILSFYKASRENKFVDAYQNSSNENEKAGGRVVYDEFLSGYHPNLDELAREQEDGNDLG